MSLVYITALQCHNGVDSVTHFTICHAQTDTGHHSYLRITA